MQFSNNLHFCSCKMLSTRMPDHAQPVMRKKGRRVHKGEDWSSQALFIRPGGFEIRPIQTTSLFTSFDSNIVTSYWSFSRNSFKYKQPQFQLPNYYSVQKKVHKGVNPTYIRGYNTVILLHVEAYSIRKHCCYCRLCCFILWSPRFLCDKSFLMFHLQTTLTTFRVII